MQSLELLNYSDAYDKVQTDLDRIPRENVPSLFLTTYLGVGMSSNVPEYTSATPNSSLAPTLANFQQYKWNLFLHQETFEAAFRSQINLEDGWKAYVLTANDSNVYTEINATNYDTVLDTAVDQNQNGSNPIMSFNFYDILKSPTPSETAPEIDLKQLLADISLLIHYDYRKFVRQTLPSYKFVPESKTLDTETVNLLLVSHQQRFNPYIKSLATLARDDFYKNQVSFYTIRRILLLLKIMIHMRIATYIDTQLNKLSYPLTTAVVEMFKNILRDFDNSSDPDKIDMQSLLATNLAMVNSFYEKTDANYNLSKTFEVTKQNINLEKGTLKENYRLTKIALIIYLTTLFVTLGMIAFFVRKNQLNAGIYLVFGVTLVSISVYVVTNYYQLEPFETIAMPSDLPSTGQQFDRGLIMQASNELIGNLKAKAMVGAYYYLLQTSVGAFMLRQNDIYKLSSDVQEQDIKQLATYNSVLSNHVGNYRMVNKLEEKKHRNHIASTWLILGLFTIMSVGVIAHFIFRPMVLVDKAVMGIVITIAIVYTGIMMFLTMRRTRRDPGKYYWSKPDYTAIVDKANATTL